MKEKSKKYEVKKLFDCQEMPEDVKKKFFEFHQKESRADGSIVRQPLYTGGTCCTEKEFEQLDIKEEELITKIVFNGKVYYDMPGTDILSDWLVENGAEVGEEVLIHYWG